MKILLPPSEGKSRARSGPALDLDRLTFADSLSRPRERLVGLLEGQGTISRKRAVAALGISAAQASEVDDNAALRHAPTAPAAEIYTGVLYDRLALTDLSPAARERADRSVLIASLLWGFVGPADRIPYYRLPPKAKLPRLGGLAAYWRPTLARAVEDAGLDRPEQLFLDLRSAAYTAAWRPGSARLLAVRAFTESGGRRKAISHMAKAARGEAARALLRSRRRMVTPETVAEVLEVAGFRVELGPDSLDLISTDCAG